MTDSLWGEIRSLLHANEIDRARTREVAQALTDGMDSERAAQLLMLIDGLTHKRGDVIIDGEWVDSDMDLSGMTIEELDDVDRKMVGLSNKFTKLRAKVHSQASDLSRQQWEAQRAAETEQERDRRIDHAMQGLSDAFTSAASSGQRFRDAFRGSAFANQGALDECTRLLERAGLWPDHHLQNYELPDLRWQPPSVIRVPAQRMTLNLAPESDDDHDD